MNVDDLWSLVGGIPTPLKNMSSSVVIMTFPIYGKIIQMFQTTNQVWFESGVPPIPTDSKWLNILFIHMFLSKWHCFCHCWSLGTEKNWPCCLEKIGHAGSFFRSSGALQIPSLSFIKPLISRASRTVNGWEIRITSWKRWFFYHLVI